MRRFKKVFFVIAAFMLLYGFDSGEDLMSEIGHPINYQNPDYEVDPLGYPNSDIKMKSIYGLRKKQNDKLYDKYNIEQLLTKFKYNYMVSER